MHIYRIYQLRKNKIQMQVYLHDLQHDFAYMRTRFHQAVRLRSLIQRESLEDDRLDGA